MSVVFSGSLWPWHSRNPGLMLGPQPGLPDASGHHPYAKGAGKRPCTTLGEGGVLLGLCCNYRVGTDTGQRAGGGRLAERQ